MISHVNGFLAITPPELRDICDSHVIQGPERIFVERLDALFQTNLNAVR